MNKDYLDSIEEFDESKLPNVEINIEEVNLVKDKVISIIEKLKQENNKTELNIDLEQALKIKRKLGDNADKAIYGVKSAVLMRSIVLEMVREKEGFTADEIVDELFIGVNVPNWWRGAAICYKFFLTKDKLIIYSFDSHYKIFNHYRLNIDEVKCAGTAEKAKCHLSEDEEIIVLPNSTIYLDPDYGGKASDLMRVMDSLRKAGIKDVDRTTFPWQFFILKAMWVLIDIVMIYLMVMCIRL